MRMAEEEKKERKVVVMDVRKRSAGYMDRLRISPKAKIHTREEVEQATREVEEKGHLLPIKDELDVGRYKPEEFDVPAEVTSDEESELGKLARPWKCAGWWGQGRRSRHPRRA